jgi:flagellar protein FliJ
MSIAENILRLRRWQLDERRRHLSELETLSVRLRADLERLKAHIDEDAKIQRRAGQDIAAPGPFGERLIERRNKLDRSIAEIEAQTAETRADVAAAESELGHHELAAAHRASVITRRTRRDRSLVPRSRPTR